MGIEANGFCHPGRILQPFPSIRSTNFMTADSSCSQIHHQQPATAASLSQDCSQLENLDRTETPAIPRSIEEKKAAGIFRRDRKQDRFPQNQWKPDRISCYEARRLDSYGQRTLLTRKRKNSGDLSNQLPKAATRWCFRISSRLEAKGQRFVQY
jgi:hypothetical protein